MAVPELAEWIGDQLAAGVSEDDIRTALVSQGWTAADIDAAFAEVRAKLAKPELPAKVEQPSRFVGAGLGLGAGLLVLWQFLDIRMLALFALEGLGELLGVLFGVLLIVGAGLLWAGRTKFGAGLILAFSITHFVLSGQLIVLAIGIVGGILGFKKR